MISIAGYPTAGANGPAPNVQPGQKAIPQYDQAGNILSYRVVQTATGPTAEGAPSAGTYNPGALLPRALLPGTNTPANTGAYANPTTVTGSQGAGIIAPGAQTSTVSTGAGQPQFNLLQTTKNPEIQSNINAATATEGQQAQEENQNFQSYLAAAQDAQNQQTADVANDTSTLNALPGQLNKSLTATNNQAATALNAANTNYANLNTTNAATVAGDVSQLQNLDTNEATAEQNATNLGVAQATGAINQRSINPSGSSGDSSEYNQAVLGTATQAQIALQNQLSQQQIQQLTNYVTPLQQSLYQGNVAQNQFAAQTAQTIAGMQTGSAEQVAALTQAVAGRPAAEAQSLLSSLGIPLQVQQQVMSSIGQSAGALTSADNANNFYGLSTTYNGTPVVLPSYQQPAPPNVPYANSYPTRSGQLPNTGNVTSEPQPMGAAHVPGAPAPGVAAPGVAAPGVAAPGVAAPGGYPAATTAAPFSSAFTPGGAGAISSSVGAALGGFGFLPPSSFMPQNLTPAQQQQWLAGIGPYSNPTAQLDPLAASTGGENYYGVQ